MRRALAVQSTEPRPKAFEELVGANLDALYGTALRLCAGRVSDAEDLLQDAMLRAFEKRSDLREPAAARGWLFTILVRTHLNSVRSTKRRAETFASDLSDSRFESALEDWSEPESPDEWLERRQSAEQVRRALDGLDPELRAVVLLSDVQGFTQRETAAVLEIPEGTVASRLFRARRALRDVDGSGVGPGPRIHCVIRLPRAVT